jgi:hypothetical protein
MLERLQQLDLLPAHGLMWQKLEAAQLFDFLSTVFSE